MEDILSLLDSLGIKRAAVLGYSMGGRVALRLGLAAPDRVSALVLESASPGIEDAAARKERRQSDAALAQMIEREGIEAFVDRWEKLPLFATQNGLDTARREALRAQRLANNPGGLANSLRGMGAGQQEPVFDRLGELRMPVLLVAGELDANYRKLARRMAKSIPNTRLEVVPGTGHTVHLEQPERFADLVNEFLQQLLPADRLETPAWAFHD